MKEHMYDPDISQLRKLHIELSSRCNASCGACNRNINGGPVVPGLALEDLSIHDIKQMVPAHIARNIKFVNFCGNLGDPGMAPDLLKVLKYFRSHSPDIIQQVRTNGGMRGPKFWGEVGEFYSECPESHDNNLFSRAGVVWSVDGLEDTNHIYRRGVKWEKVWANMKAYSQTGAKAIWEFLVFGHNEHQIEEARSRCNDLGFAFALKNPLGFGENIGDYTPFHIMTKEGVYDYSIFPAGWNQSREVSDEIKNQVFKPDLIASTKKIPVLSEFSSDLAKTSTVKCRSAEDSEIYISSTGHLLPCCYLGGTLSGNASLSYSRYQFINEFEKLGSDMFDLRKKSIEEIIFNEKFIGLFLNGWKAKSVEEGKLLFCTEMCGECSPLEKLYQNKKF